MRLKHLQLHQKISTKCKQYVVKAWLWNAFHFCYFTSWLKIKVLEKVTQTVTKRINSEREDIESRFGARCEKLICLYLSFLILLNNLTQSKVRNRENIFARGYNGTRICSNLRSSSKAHVATIFFCSNCFSTICQSVPATRSLSCQDSINCKDDYQSSQPSSSVYKKLSLLPKKDEHFSQHVDNCDQQLNNYYDWRLLQLIHVQFKDR